eukprot:g13889.t1
MHRTSLRTFTVVLNLLLAHFSSAFIPSGQALPRAAFGGRIKRTFVRAAGGQLDELRLITDITTCLERRRRSRMMMHANNVPVFSEGDSYATMAGLEMEESPTLGLQLTAKAIDVLFGFEPFFDLSVRKAREKIVKRSSMVGVNWSESIDNMRRNMDELEKEYDRLLDRKISTPSYYYAPFHCYPDGNLSWKAALEVDPSAVSVHANIYTGNEKVYEPDGDDKLRGNYHQRMREMLKGAEPKDILDVGCSTGLSTIKLARAFPSARIFGVDLSPHMLAVGRFNLRTKEELREARDRVQYLHAAGEMSGMGDSSMDLVSLSLTSHELPVEATRDIFREAYRVLRPGGALSFMDMNPLSPAFQEVIQNPFAFAGFKSSEPYLMDYFTLDLGPEIVAAGFRDPEPPQHEVEIDHFPGEEPSVP